MVVVIVNNNNNNNNNNNHNHNHNFPDRLWTRRGHSLIRKEDHGPSMSTCPTHTVDVRQCRQMGTCAN